MLATVQSLLVFLKFFVAASALANTGLTESNISYKNIKNLIQKKNVKTIEDFLPFLPKSYLTHFSMMRSSMSLQEGSKENPRVLLFGRDAKMILSFNGSPQQKGFYNIEILSFKNNNTPNFFEITFPQDTKNKVHFSSQNPPQCMQCHTAYPKPNGITKPIWNAYPTWPGAYGEADDKKSEKYEPYYKRFQHLSKRHSRYKHLNFSSRDQDTRGLHPTPRDTRPNLKLTELLIFRHAKFLAQKITRHSFFKKYPLQSILALSAANHPDTRSLLCLRDQHAYASKPNEARAFLEQNLNLHESSFYLDFDEDKIRSNYLYTGTSAMSSLTNLIFYQIYKVEPSLFKKHFTYKILSSAGNYGTLKTSQHYKALFKISWALNSLKPKSCKQLRGYLNMKKTPPALPLHTKTTKTSTLSHCAACHTKAYGAEKVHIGPYMPFDQPENFTSKENEGLIDLIAFYTATDSNVSPEEDFPLFLKPAHKGGHRMPYGRKALSLKERQQLLRHLREGLHQPKAP